VSEQSASGGRPAKCKIADFTNMVAYAPLQLAALGLGTVGNGVVPLPQTTTVISPAAVGDSQTTNVEFASPDPLCPIPIPI